MSGPVQLTVLDLEHLDESATAFQYADDAIPHVRAGDGVFHAIDRVSRSQQPLFFFGANTAVVFRLALGFYFDANRWKGDVVKIGGVRPRPQLMVCRKMAGIRLS